MVWSSYIFLTAVWGTIKVNLHIKLTVVWGTKFAEIITVTIECLTYNQ